MIVLLGIMYSIPGSDNGSYENIGDSFHMLAHGAALDAFVVVYLISIAMFNFLGVTMSGKLSAVHRTIVDAVRTSLVWTVQIIAYYGVNKNYGNAWGKHSWVQLIGFVFLV